MLRDLLEHIAVAVCLVALLALWAALGAVVIAAAVLTYNLWVGGLLT